MRVPRTQGRFGPETRFCILGAGASGITVAESLRQLGYREITLLDPSRSHPGGQCWTVASGDSPLDRGAIFYFANYPTLDRLRAQEGVALRPAPRFQHLGTNGQLRPYGTAERSVSRLVRVAECTRLAVALGRSRRLFHGEIGECGLDELHDLTQPLSTWITRHRLDYFHEVAYPLMRSFGFGFEEHEVPALYLVKALPQLTRGSKVASLWDLSALSMYHVVGGYGGLFQRIAAHHDVRLGATARRIVRDELGGVVQTDAGEIPFDVLVLACPLDRILGVLDASEEEAVLFRGIRAFPVWQAVARVSGMPDGIILDRNQRWATRGRLMILSRYAPETDLYYLFGYVADGQDEADIADAIRADVSDAGGQVHGAPQITRWERFFPHYGAAELAADYHTRLERLQGQRATFYAGELLSNLGVESAASYAERLVGRCIGPPCGAPSRRSLAGAPAHDPAA